MPFQPLGGKLTDWLPSPTPSGSRAIGSVGPQRPASPGLLLMSCQVNEKYEVSAKHEIQPGSPHNGCGKQADRESEKQQAIEDVLQQFHGCQPRLMRAFCQESCDFGAMGAAVQALTLTHCGACRGSHRFK